MQWKATVRISDSRAVKAVGCLVAMVVFVQEDVEGVCRCLFVSQWRGKKWWREARMKSSECAG
jgi:hypothetical protein